MGNAKRETSEVTSPSLLERARARDAAAWHRITQLYGPIVYRWARNAGLQASDASDVAQEVFWTVSQRLGDFRRDRAGDSFRGWLWGITRNKLKQFRQKVAGRAQGIGGTDAQIGLNQLPDLTPEESAQSILDDRAMIVRRALEQVRPEFEPATFLAFWRTVVDGQKAKDVADELQKTYDAVRKASSRVRQRLEQELKGLI
jgi:RNA polymerase sigma-70 factor (ECF subfamily)